MSLPPYSQGIAAFRDGQPKTANPHPIGTLTGDHYPGPHDNWHDGWMYAQGIKQHEERINA